MLDREALLEDLKRLVGRLEKDLRERCEANPEIDAKVRAEYQNAREGKRTAQTYAVWRDDWITQVAVAWVLSIVFVRFIEDNALVPAPLVSGPDLRLQFAKERKTAFFQQHPALTDREYLESVFREVSALPAMKDLFDEQHNPVWALGVSGDGAKAILTEFQRIDPATGTLIHEFTDSSLETRFLGDLYQDLSEAARKKYALLQTPEFVEEFILDRTLDPAIAEFGLETVRMIDPTCGSGHFLLGGFARLFRLWREREPATNPTVLAQRALDGVWGVDLNPYAVAISRFRLLVAAMKASSVRRLADMPEFRIHLAVGDSLLHGPRFAATLGVQAHMDPEQDPVRNLYGVEVADDLRPILGQQYHSVVGNPPYITVKDKALNEAYRQKYGSCSGKYSLSVPFMERFFELAVRGEDGEVAGFVGQITANSFMKREFGAKLIEKFIPGWDLTHMIDASGAYIPGHGTPTVILFGRNRLPNAGHVRAVMGIRGEPSTPDDPAKGLVWTAITTQIDEPGSTSEWLSVVDSPRGAFHKHPWSVGGGGAAELKELIEQGSKTRLGEIAESIGITSFTLEDDIYILPREAARRRGMTTAQVRPMLVGDEIRDWTATPSEVAVFPYDDNFEPIADDPNDARLRYLWQARTMLANNMMFGGKTKVESGLKWYEFGRLTSHKLRTPLSIAYAEVATHNHFLLDRGGKVFKQTAPVIKLPPDATEDDHLALLGLLNSSTACFWLKQVSHSKGVGGIGGGIGDEKWEPRYAFDSSKVGSVPVVDAQPAAETKRMVDLERKLSALTPAVMASEAAPTTKGWELASVDYQETLELMIATQEELDWRCYQLYGIGGESPLTYDGDLPRVRPGERAFEIVLARRVTEGLLETAWFDRHGATPTTTIPPQWPSSYRALIQRRIDSIEHSADIRLIEQPENKRRWTRLTWDSQAEDSIRTWLLTRLELPSFWSPQLISTTQLAHVVSADAAFSEAAEIYRGTADFDIISLVKQLALIAAVPMLPIDRYKESGLRSREGWEKTWDLQRCEDRGENVGEVPVPPKYKSSDFKSSVYWSLRGKLDVPKERFISFPGCERESDPSLPILWAGYDHLQQARAIAAYYQDLKENEAAPAAKLAKLLAAILELLPWLKQWHNDVDPEFNLRMGDFYEAFLNGELGALGMTMDNLRKVRGL